ncbi:hypothetical protein JCM6882_000234 [Rhodosporidiobolus microsporus]
MSPPPAFTDIELPFQRPLVGQPWDDTPSKGLPFPLALQTDSSIKTLDDFIAAVEVTVKRGELIPLLTQHGGAILFRGTHATSPEDFSRIAHAFKLGPPHEELGNPVIRTLLAKNVATANEGPSTHPVYPHSEFGWSSHYPSFLSFFCRHPADEGGETPINSSAEVFSRLQAEIPEFIDELAEKGISYEYSYKKERNPGSNLGNDVKTAYGGANLLPTDDEATSRAKIEEQIKRHSNEWRWDEDGTLSVTHRLSIIRRDPFSKLPIVFGNLASMTALAKKWDALEPPHLGTDGAYHHLPTYGDGTPIPTKYLERLLEMVYDVQAYVKYELGDVLLMDNHLVQHARQPWVGDRRVLASLWDGPPPLPYKETNAAFRV